MSDAVHLWLTVTKPGAMYPSGPYEVWTRDVQMGHTPAEGDQIALWCGEDGDPDGGPMWTIQRRWWNADGELSINLVTMVVDPNEQMEQVINRQVATGGRYVSPWRTDQEGYGPEGPLETSGWRRY